MKLKWGCLDAKEGRSDSKSIHTLSGILTMVTAIVQNYRKGRDAALYKDKGAGSRRAGWFKYRQGACGSQGLAVALPRCWVPGI